MRARVGVLVLLAASLLSSTASAQPWNPVGRTDRNGNPGVVRIPQGISTVRPDDPWTENLARRIYNSDLGPDLLNRPLEFIYPLYDWGMNDFDDGIAAQLAYGCRRAYPNDAWAQITCASVAVEMFLDDHDLDDFPRSPCRSHQRAFAEVLERLRIPGVSTGPLTMPGHVLNRLYVTTADGQVLEYAIDTGWNPDRVYPNSEAARRFHDRNGDGVTDHFGLPVLTTGEPPRNEYVGPVPSPSPSPSREGNNVARNASTAAPGTVAMRAARAGVAAGAGRLRD